MNKRLQLLALLFCFVRLAAQPSITAAVHQPLVGDTLAETYLSLPGFVAGPTGPGQIFSFTGASPSGSVMQGVFAAQVGLPPWNYNLMVHLTDGVSYRDAYFQASADSLTDAGFDTGAADFTPFESHNPTMKFPFPFAYGDSFRDPYSGQHQSIFGYVPFVGTVDVVADAWGDLVLGIDTIPDVLRLHTIDTLRETYLGTPVMVVRECYEYYAATIRFPVLSACTDPLNGGAYSFYSALRTGLITAVQPETQNPMRVYPNPFQGRLRVDVSTDGVLEITDLQGKILVARTMHAGVNELDLSALPAGAYQAITRSGGGTWQRLLVRE